MLFADATALTAEPALSDPARDAIRAVAAHLADLIRRAQADGEISSGTDPEAAAWLLLSVLSARRLRAAAMPAGLEPAVAAITLQAITSPLSAASGIAAALSPAPAGRALLPERERALPRVLRGAHRLADLALACRTPPHGASPPTPR